MKKQDVPANVRKALNKSRSAAEDRVNVTYYTDPLCCWSWAFEKHWRRFQNEFSDRINVRYVMGGMIPDWNQYNDPLNSVSRPLQMGPVWMHASQVTHTPMDYTLWHEDPPSSSYPGCIAVKCAMLQSAELGENYLFRLREAVMTKHLNIAKYDVLKAIAADMPDNLDIDRFVGDWKAGNGHAAFREDLKLAGYHKIGRFPTLTFSNASGKGIMIVGYRPYEMLSTAFMQMETV